MHKNRSNGYDLIAPVYDDGVGLLFGKGIFDAQIHFLSQIPAHSKILILGGGSGWILNELFKRVSNPVVCYIDASKKMISIARKKISHQVQFICGTENDIPDEKFDFIITHFYVDGFSYSVLKEKISFISKFLHDNGKWIVTDFVETGKKKHTIILWFTHLFFRMLVHHPNKTLVDWRKAFDKMRFEITSEQDFNHGFIQSILYSRTN